MKVVSNLNITRMKNHTEIYNNYTTEASEILPNLPGTVDEIESNDDNLSYLLVPFFSLLIIIILTIIVIVLLHRKRRIDRLRHHLMPFYTFAPGEEEDWETELLESEGEVQARRDYNSFPLLKSL
ncbi:small integral membrane protein 29-like isoform X1 [Rhodnius prolixus]|uniref:small integral membrane protein 29-like isoform X1 n=1 Tax=Rhodnius prolixus TaxID=13249 RepID=UPI003D188D4C